MIKSVLAISEGGPDAAMSFRLAARVAGAMATAWEAGFRDFRDQPGRAAEPCASCDYLHLCRGGCRAVALAHGGMRAPGPGCPAVHEHALKNRPKTSLPVVQA